MRETFGDRLKKARKAKGFTQQQVGAWFQNPDTKDPISRAAVAQWEADETKPDTDKLPVLAKRLGVTLDYLFFGVDDLDPEPVNDSDPLKKQLIGLYDALSASRRDRLVEQANLLHNDQYPHASPANPFPLAVRVRSTDRGSLRSLRAKALRMRGGAR